MKTFFEKARAFIHKIYRQLVTMDDSPQRIAIGFGVGVFIGLLPATGPVAALAIAYIFRMNKPAVFLGSLLTNTWLTLLTFFLALKIGAGILGLRLEDLHDQAAQLFRHFSFKAMFNASMKQVLKPLLVGYAVVGLACGLATYGAAFIILKRRKRL